MNMVEELKAACEKLQASRPGMTVAAGCEVTLNQAGAVEIEFQCYTTEIGFHKAPTLAEAVGGIIGINRVQALLAQAEDLERQARSVRAKAKAEAEGGAR